MKVLPLALGGILIVTAAFAQAPLPHPPAAGPQAQDMLPPPPPGSEEWAAGPHGPGPHGPKGDRPPPPRGSAIHIERGNDGAMRLDVKCADSDTTKDCADVTSQLLEKLNGTAKH